MNDLNQTLGQPSVYERINLQPWRSMSRLPVIVQNERAECGLACLAMVSGYFGQRYDLATLRHELGHVDNGMDLKQLIQSAGGIGLSSRPVKAQLHSLRHLKKPCILHWDMNHFVVLKKAGRNSIEIHDPAVGLVKMNYQKASQLFTGIAIELQPNQAFQPQNKSVIPSFRSLMGKTDGLAKSLVHILILSLLLQLIGLVSPAIMQWLIDNGLSTGDQSVIVTLVAGMAMLMVFNLTLGVLRSWMVMYLSTHVGFQWSSRILRHLFHLPVDFFERRHLGDILSRFGSVATIQQTVTTGVISGILDGLFGALILVMIWLYSPTLAMTAITAVVLLTLLQLTTFAKQKRLANEALMTEAKVSSSLMETIRGIRSVKLAARSDLRKSLWQNLTIDSINANVKGQWLGIAVTTAGSLISGSQRLIAIFLAATMISEGQFTIGMLFAYLAYQDQFMGRANSLVGIYFQFKMLRLHFERLADIVLTKPETLECIKEISTEEDSGKSKNQNPVGASAAGSTAFTGEQSVEFRQVSFAYAENSPSVLDNISFSSAGSKCTVITGRSGIGKTTIFKMLMGIYKPTSGEIFINGTPLTNLPVDTLRTNISCVLQDDSLFAGSISENIAFFDMDIDQQRVEECAKIACIHDDIERTVMKYHSMVGDMGSMLSAGQKQRLLIARALYRNPKILLLDEATSDLDVNTEEELNKNLAELDVHRIYIAHRPQTIKYGDNVVKLDHQ